MRPVAAQSVATRPVAALAALLTVATAAPAVAQSHWAQSGWDVRAQYDRPGDYRCDAYWDANRTDCHARWRDQRRYSSHGRPGWSHGDDYRRWSSYPAGYRPGYGHGHGQSGGEAWSGAYGRPDLVYPGGGHGGWSHGVRDPRRIDWCRASYRSYDPASGYYRTYDGRWVFCG